MLWRGVDEWRAEACFHELTSEGVRGSGTQIGADPVPYRLEYRLDASPGWLTRTLEVAVEGEGWSRRLRLKHDGRGAWRCRAEASGAAPGLPPPGIDDPGDLDGALDCDLGRSPLTNVMPIRRHSLHSDPGEVDFTMAWVSVPDLGVHRATQRYEHVRPGVVRYVGEHRDFVGELEVDGDGMVVVYPELAERV